MCENTRVYRWIQSCAVLVLGVGESLECGVRVLTVMCAHDISLTIYVYYFI